MKQKMFKQWLSTISPIWASHLKQYWTQKVHDIWS